MVHGSLRQQPVSSDVNQVRTLLLTVMVRWQGQKRTDKRRKKRTALAFTVRRHTLLAMTVSILIHIFLFCVFLVAALFWWMLNWANEPQRFFDPARVPPHPSGRWTITRWPRARLRNPALFCVLSSSDQACCYRVGSVTTCVQEFNKCLRLPIKDVGDLDFRRLTQNSTVSSSSLQSVRDVFTVDDRL